LSVESAKAALALINQYFGIKPIKAIIYSHSHIDHFGGVKGIINEQRFIQDSPAIIAPEGFTHHAISENVLAGNAMARRAIYMFGSSLPIHERGALSSGLGLNVSKGNTSLILPTDTISATGEERIIDGIKMQFQWTPGTEAPTEMNTWFPEKKALWMAENATHTMHNIVTLRGAPVRDALQWAKYLNETLTLWGSEAEVVFQSHHWPVWGQANIEQHLKAHRDVYKYLHDQTLRLLNQGYSAGEIAESIELPLSLANNWSTRGYYGTLKHNVRAIYQRYMGWYSANPSDLDPLPPIDTAKKMVVYMGGSDNILSKAQQDFERGEYRWVSQVLKHVVFSEPENIAAKNLLADAYEQLGYQSESGPWRSIYLQGALELRRGIPYSSKVQTASEDIVQAMPVSLLLDYMATQLIPENAQGLNLNLGLEISDTSQHYQINIEHSVLHHSLRSTTSVDLTLILNKSVLSTIIFGNLNFEQAAQQGHLQWIGDEAILQTLDTLFTSPQFWFNIVTP
jgi:alkyl sulfatase BDS1-like metallo-beta-lactamase superfamily hydrolase